MHEDDFSKNILKPLFESMGYERVEFNGGSHERGRDLIAQKRLPPRREMHLTYIQSKKIGSIQNTKTAAKLSQLIHQLRQCCVVEITDMEGIKTKPDIVFLACPEPISTRLIEEIDGQLFDSRIRVYPYDGPKIISDILEYKPELLNLLTTTKDKLTSNSPLPSGNDELLAALKNKRKICLEDFYCDLSFFVGSVDSNLLLHLELEFKTDKLNVAEDCWENVKNELKNLSNIHEFNIFNLPVTNIEKTFLKLKKEYGSEKNKESKKEREALKNEISNLSETIDKNIQSLSSLPVDVGNTKNHISSVQISKRDKILSNLKRATNDKTIRLFDEYNPKIKTEISFYKNANLIASWITEKRNLTTKLDNVNSRIIDKPTYKLKINTKGLTSKIEEYRHNYFTNISLINKREIGPSKIKTFLLETEKTLSLISKLKNKTLPLAEIISFKRNKNAMDRVSISPHDIFYTGHDIAVYGGAGVGKTTTLQAYADTIYNHEDTVLFYIPLNKLVDEFNKVIVENEKFKNKHLLIKIILLSKGMNPTKENIKEARKIIPKNSTIILDGLDEIYNTIPEIIPAISEFKKNNKDSQLIVSSRDCVSYLNDIDFLGITLLPFTKVQLNTFVRGWFNDSKKSDALIKAIENRDLYHHIKTPLLATITCSLVEKGVNAPSTENEIYSERLCLLTGEYDLHKSIDRQKQKGGLLRKCAISLAFSMHVKNIRTLSKRKMLDILHSRLSETYDKSLLSDCLDELINPCNVIEKDRVTSTYSFGHFRFQEHLASEELKSNRSIDLPELATRDWWRGTLCLYAQDNEFSYLIEDVYKKYGEIESAKLTLQSMINNSNLHDKKSLTNILNGYETADALDNFIYDDDLFGINSYDNTILDDYK